MPKQFEAFIEDSTGTVIGYVDSAQTSTMLPKDEQFPRALQKFHAETSATKLGIELPAEVKKALKELKDPVEAPKTAEPGLE